MPLTGNTTRKAKSHPPEDQEQQDSAAKRPRSEAIEPETTEPGRPHQAFVESEARKYWQEIGKEHNLTKPTQDEIRAAALPILCQALRNKQGNRRHQAVDAVQLHAGGRGWITPPYSRLLACPGYIDALIQLADDADWLAREIPLPDHPPPRHPTMYYTIDPQSNWPVPRDDSYIRGEYVYRRLTGHRVTSDHRIIPVEITDDDNQDPFIYYSLGRDSWFTLISGPTDVQVEIHWLDRIGPHYNLRRVLLKDLVFSPDPALMQGSGRERPLTILDTMNQWLPFLALIGLIIALFYRYI